MKRQRLGNIVIIAFLIVQALDGSLTYQGVSTSFLGIEIEANPIVVKTMSFLGVGLGILFLKLVAVVLGIFMYFQNWYITLALLTGFYCIFALGSWFIIYPYLY